jgi:hypothetical protein
MTQEDMPSERDIRKRSEGTIGFLLGDLRPSNIAVGVNLSRVDVDEYLDRAMINNGDMTCVNMWFDNSELAVDRKMWITSNQLENRFPGRAGHIVLAGQHNGVNYRPVHTAAAVTAVEMNLALPLSS